MDNSTHAKLRAPRQDGEVLIWPEPRQWLALASANHAQLRRSDARIGGLSRWELALQARGELLEAAIAWTRRYRSIPEKIPAGKGALPPIYMTGHQPELFHPGVWLKNALLYGAAHAGSAIGIHLIVDSDVLKSASVAVPAGSLEQPVVGHVPVDGGYSGVPFEDRPVHDFDLFHSFDRRVCEATRGTVSDPMVGEFWSYARAALDVTSNLGHTLAVARHRWEEWWGWQTLEVPQSWLCRLPSFLLFASCLWQEAKRFRTIHNRAVDEYRRRHRLRSRSHPFPHLQESDGWCEVPFWTWTGEHPRRQRLFVRRNGPCLELGDLGSWKTCIPESSCMEPQWLRSWLHDLEKTGRRIRCRAVVTTLWCRWCLSDLFIHGIGGAKYDQVTDTIMREFLGGEPPAYATATATVLLPVPRPLVDQSDLRRLHVQLRELEFHPEKHLCLENLSQTQRRTVERLVAEKWEWIRAAVTPENAAERFRRIRAINRELQTYVEPERRRLWDLLRETQAKLNVNKVLGSREWAFCLYPSDHLHAFYSSVLRQFFD